VGFVLLRKRLFWPFGRTGGGARSIERGGTGESGPRKHAGDGRLHDRAARLAGSPAFMLTRVLVVHSNTTLLSCVQKVYHRFDFLFGQDQIAPERRHAGERVALGLVGNDRGKRFAIWIAVFHVGKRWPDVARSVAASDLVTGEAISFAAVEGQRFPRHCRCGGLRRLGGCAT